MNLHVVTHCYCPPGVTIYAQHIRWQFASFVAHPITTGKLIYTIFCSPDDNSTRAAVREMAAVINRMRGVALELREVVLDERALYRRAIGRNIIADNVCSNDVVHFTDADYFYGAGCADSILENVAPSSSLTMPQSYRICDTHALGDSLVERSKQLSVDDLVDYLLAGAHAPSFTERRTRQAIGGIQFIGGSALRRIGYLRDTKWVQPVSTEEGFRSCRCDKVWRRVNNLQAEKVPIETLYRIRHTVDGRDYDTTGARRGREVW